MSVDVAKTEVVHTEPGPFVVPPLALPVRAVRHALPTPHETPLVAATLETIDWAKAQLAKHEHLTEPEVAVSESVQVLCPPPQSMFCSVEYVPH